MNQPKLPHAKLNSANRSTFTLTYSIVKCVNLKFRIEIN